MARKVEVGERILSENDRRAEENRRLLGGAFCVNLMSSPGAGKTLLLERTVPLLKAKGWRVAVVEGDVATENDARRMRRVLPASAVAQIRTENYGGGCHLDAGMVGRALRAVGFPRRRYDAVFIENVGNLICPAEFRLGEDVRVVLVAVTEGEDKPLKYPVMFRAADMVLVTKVDLAEAAGADVRRLRSTVRKVHPRVEVLEVSARTGEGLEAWVGWLEGRRSGRSAG